MLELLDDGCVDEDVDLTMELEDDEAGLLLELLEDLTLELVDGEADLLFEVAGVLWLELLVEYSCPYSSRAAWPTVSDLGRYLFIRGTYHLGEGGQSPCPQFPQDYPLHQHP